MFPDISRLTAQGLLHSFGLRQFVYYADRLPEEASVIVVSNHRSFLDAAILINTVQRPLRIACHHYMGQVPIFRELIHLLGCFPLAQQSDRSQEFLKQANQLLQQGDWVGLFPEGATPMLNVTHPQEITKFERGYAHLALKNSKANLAILPIAIASVQETVQKGFPVRLLQLFDASEPLFDNPQFHPIVIYHHVNVLIGRPYWVTEQDKQAYHGKQAKRIVTKINEYCQREITDLLKSSH